MSKPLRIAIVGFGSAGAASAILLANDGHDVTLFERAPENSPIGAGFLLQPTGLAVLKELGIHDAVLRDTTVISQLHCINDRGATMLNLHYGELYPGIVGAGTHRTTLFKHLEDAVYKAGVNLRWGTEITSVTTQQNLHQLLDIEGNTHGPFDLLLVCDGSRSTLREQINLPCSHKQYPWGALWFIGKRDDAFHPRQLWQSVSSTDKLCGFLPTGTEHDLLSMFWSIRMDRIDQWRNTPLGDWKESVLALAPQAEEFLQQISSHDDLSVASYHDVVMRKWHTNNSAILGDAAHALSPQLGQGVNLALVDASTLAECLRDKGLTQGLEMYSKLRKKHLGFYQHATRWATPFFQSDYNLLGIARDLTFPLMNAMPWARKQMTATMAGLKTGPFSMLPPEDFT